jgi:5-oxoprolinase (ATP-hydrolysing) subunit A
VKKVDLNVDIGEGFPNDEALLEFATSANVCCGEHAGSWELTQATVAMCLSKEKRIGMHPGFPDRESMGRTLPYKVPSEWLDSIRDQATKFCAEFKADYVKPHGAWYQALTDESLVKEGRLDAGSFGGCGGLLFGMAVGLPALILAGSRVGEIIAGSEGVVISEGFADRAYRLDGTLVPRSEPGAVLHDRDQIKQQVLNLAPKVDSICLHGDTSDCLEFAELVYKTLLDNRFEVGY